MLVACGAEDGPYVAVLTVGITNVLVTDYASVYMATLILLHIVGLVQTFKCKSLKHI